jgi:hypothetical protein
MRNTKRLSIESEYSVIQPAKNSADLVCPPQLRSEIPKAIAAETYIPVQIAASFKVVIEFR